MKKLFLVGLSLVLLWSLAGQALAYVSASSNYRLEKDSINFGGLDEASSTNYKASTTLGEMVSGVSNGTNYNASSGYRYMESEVPASTPPASVPGCTDPTANNYNASATVNDGSCTYSGGPVTVQVPGCTDPTALNYKASATVNDGSCIYAGVPNVSGFSAEYQANDNRVRLTWTNPNYANLASVIIRRGKGSVPASPTDGVLIYNGTNQSAYDYDVEAGAHYYYVAFVRSTFNTYSSGVVASATITAQTETPTEPPTETPTNPPGGPTESPFTSLPTAPGGEVVTSSLSEDWSFLFLQPQEKAKIFDRFMSVRIDGEKPLTILFNYNLAPETLKTIGVTLTDPEDPNKTFSFLMYRTKDGSAYQATIGALKRRGTYPMDVYIINYNNQTTKHIRGSLIASSALVVRTEAIVKEVVAPVAVSTGLAVSFFPSFLDWLVNLFRVLPYAFGRRRKGESWGTVYDSETKRPLDPVYVIAEQEDPITRLRKEVATAITDIDGRFGFFLPAGIYYLKANKTHYRFPSTRLAGRTSDEIYHNLYFGGALNSTGNEVLDLNIPMDPIDFDWNEFAKTKTDFFRFYNRRKLWLNRLWHVLFMAGFLFSIYISYLQPLLINFIVVGFYPVLFLLDRFYHEKRKPLTVSSARTKEPLPFSIIRVFLPDLNQQIKYAVADQYGRFYLLVRPGVYYYTVEEKMPDGSYQKVYQSTPVNLPKGVLTADISVK